LQKKISKNFCRRVKIGKRKGMKVVEDFLHSLGGLSRRTVAADVVCKKSVSRVKKKKTAKKAGTVNKDPLFPMTLGRAPFDLQ